MSEVNYYLKGINLAKIRQIKLFENLIPLKVFLQVFRCFYAILRLNLSAIPSEKTFSAIRQN